MLTEICAELKNWFVRKGDRHVGKFAIVNGAITPSLDILTDYVKIEGSRKNDGVHKVPASDLVDEPEFDGVISIMSPPKAFLELAKEIADWQKKYGAVDSAAMSPFSSESFGGYSYSKSSGEMTASGGVNGTTWRGAFASRLNVWRKI